VAKEATEELVEKVAKETVEDAAENIFKETGEELLEKASKETLAVVTENTLEETSEELIGKVSQTVVEKGTKEVTSETTGTVLKETSKATVVNETTDSAKIISKKPIATTSEAAERFLRGEFGAVKMGEVGKLPDDILEIIKTGPDSSVLVKEFQRNLDELIDPLSIQRGFSTQPVHINITSGRYYISKTPDEAKVLLSEAKKLVDAGETGKAIEIVKELAHGFKRGNGDKAIIGRYPFYIDKALEEGGVFFDVGESWDDLVKIFDNDKYGAFLANEEFLYILRDYDVKSIELVTDMNKPLPGGGSTSIKLLDWFEEFNSKEFVPWNKMSFGQMEALSLETSPLFERTTDTIWKFR